MSVDFTTAFASIGSSEPWYVIEEEFAKPVANARNILEQLQSIKEVGQVAIGVNGFFALNTAAVRKSVEYVVILNAPLREQQFWKIAAPMIAKASDRHTLFIDLRYQLGDSELLEEQSWLCDDDLFAKIQTIFKEKHFVCLDIVLQDTVRCSMISGQAGEI